MLFDNKEQDIIPQINFSKGINMFYQIAGFFWLLWSLYLFLLSKEKLQAIKGSKKKNKEFIEQFGGWLQAASVVSALCALFWMSGSMG